MQWMLSFCGAFGKPLSGEELPSWASRNLTACLYSTDRIRDTEEHQGQQPGESRMLDAKEPSCCLSLLRITLEIIRVHFSCVLVLNPYDGASTKLFPETDRKPWCSKLVGDPSNKRPCCGPRPWTLPAAQKGTRSVLPCKVIWTLCTC